jgi:hypothetical protein
LPDERAPNPAEPGTTGEQRAAEPHPEIIPADRSAAVGLQGALLEELHGALPVGVNIRRVLGIIGRESDRRLRECMERVQRLLDELSNERVAHARTDERLQTLKGQSGSQTLLLAVGGAGLGWAVGKFLEGQPSWPATAAGVVSLAFVLFGAWPVIRARRGRGDGG